MKELSKSKTRNAFIDVMWTIFLFMAAAAFGLAIAFKLAFG